MPAGYNDDVPGVLIGGVAENGPADKAGLKEGDRIVELAGKPVKNIQVYMVIMATQKRGQPVDVGILRKGRKMTVKVKPQ
jgi:S1-C subfamily serine protease